MCRFSIASFILSEIFMTKLCRLKLVGPVIMNQRVRVERVACVSDALVDVMTHLD